MSATARKNIKYYHMLQFFIPRCIVLPHFAPEDVILHNKHDYSLCIYHLVNHTGVLPSFRLWWEDLFVYIFASVTQSLSTVAHGNHPTDEHKNSTGGQVYSSDNNICKFVGVIFCFGAEHQLPVRYVSRYAKMDEETVPGFFAQVTMNYELWSIIDCMRMRVIMVSSLFD